MRSHGSERKEGDLNQVRLGSKGKEGRIREENGIGVWVEETDVGEELKRKREINRPSWNVGSAKR